MKKAISRTFWSLSGFGLGAAAMYFLDPQRGSRRRAEVRQRGVHVARRSGNAIKMGLADLGNRSRGLILDTRARIAEQETPADDILVARVRSRLGRLVSHPHSVEVSVDAGRVTLKGRCAPEEVPRLVSSLHRVRGVREVDNQLLSTPMDATGGRQPGKRFRARRARFLRIRKSIDIEAPVSQVFQFWANFENFPRFMKDVREVRTLPGGKRSHWVVDGPGGAPLSWDAVVTRKVPNEYLSWRTMPGSVIHNAGRVRFRANDEGGTRVELELSYHPPGALLGRVAAQVFGFGPKLKVARALAQMKTLIEEGPSRRQIIGMHAQGA
ncbi:MAG: SRPBCC family protein [Oligoflexia bacterium]|nr:SRPBCC family protein [Oligoflexia bacterium]